ncbi:MAG: WS/DGAT domain-containing protein [Candidatus Competibacteraceae bacterium]
MRRWFGYSRYGTRQLRPLDQVQNLGNYFGLVFLTLPIGIAADPVERLYEVRKRMEQPSEVVFIRLFWF